MYRQSSGRGKRLIVIAAAPLLLAGLSVGQAFAATGGPDATGYTYTDSSEAGGPGGGPFTSIATTGTDIGNHCDDCTTAITLPFPESFYNDNTSQVNVSSNGNIQFDSDTSDYSAPRLPTTVFNSVMLPFQADLRTDGAGAGIFIQTFGSAPSQRVIIEWDTATYGSGVTEDFQVVLAEDSPVIQFRYLDIDPGPAHTVGIQGGSGTGNNFLQYNSGNQEVNDSLAIEFDRSTLNDKTVLTASPTSHSTYGQSVKLTAKITRTDGSTQVPTGSVQFGDKNGVLATKPLNSSGIATLTTTKLLPGTDEIYARYAGDGSASVSYAEIPYTVATAKTTTTIAPASGSSIVYGAPVTARVKAKSPGAGTPTGRVDWYDAATSTYLTTTSLVNGIATLPPTVLQAGNTYELNAQYQGDGGDPGKYSASQSQDAQLTVTQAATTTTLAGTPNPAAYGKKVTFTATVKGMYPHTVPSESVTFADNGDPIGTAPIVNGVATLSTNSLSRGTHSITATYDGDSNLIGSTSNTVNEQITGN